jgi:adenosylmethionine-8-amino-7-oxononanoate aminotransferase
MIPLNFPPGRTTLTVTGTDRYWVTTKEHGRMLETLCGNTAFIFGFNNQHIIDRVAQQQQTLSYLVHTNYTCDDNDLLIEKISTAGNLHGVGYAVSGSDGVECAVAMNDYYWFLKDKTKTKIVSFSPGYHGITFLARALRGIEIMPYKNLVLDAPKWSTLKQRRDHENVCFYKLKRLLETDSSIGAVIMESVPWINGLKPWSEKWWKDIRDICTQYGVNLIIDDVLGGMGKLGEVFSHTRYGIQPDIAVLGKALTGGYSPLSCACTSKEIADTIKSTWEYGHTWQPNMMGVAAALACFELLDLKAVPLIEQRMETIYKRLQENGHIKEYVIIGLMNEVVFRAPFQAEDMHQVGLSNNIHPDGTQIYSITLCTPLIANDEYFEELEIKVKTLAQKVLQI